MAPGRDRRQAERRHAALGALWRSRRSASASARIILLLHLLVAVIGPFWAPYGHGADGDRASPLSGMSWAHPFGVDQLGRDIFSRVIHGGHIVILLSLLGTTLGLAIGSVVGLLSRLSRRLDRRGAAALHRGDRSASPSWCWR